MYEAGCLATFVIATLEIRPTNVTERPIPAIHLLFSFLLFELMCFLWLSSSNPFICNVVNA